MIRSFVLLGTFSALLTALFVFWQMRFERAPEYSTVRLADLRGTATPAEGVEWLGSESNPSVRLRVDKPDIPTVVRIKFPRSRPVDFMHVRVRMKSRGLKVGRDPWADGRCIIEWHSVLGGGSENGAVASIRGDDPGEVIDFVMRPKQSPAEPMLRLENLGQEGELELTQFEATGVRERWVWKIGQWFLLAAWLAWAYALVIHAGAKGHLRSLLAASVWLLMGIFFVVPGPWENLRPLAVPFEMGPEGVKLPLPATEAKSQVASDASDAEAIKPIGKISIQGDLLLRIKFQFLQLRPLLHLLLLLGPAFLIGLLVGKRPALWLTAIFSIGTEVAEVAFGYGFDSADVGDLIWDAAGIGLGVWLSHFVLNLIYSRRKVIN